MVKEIACLQEEFAAKPSARHTHRERLCMVSVDDHLRGLMISAGTDKLLILRQEVRRYALHGHLFFSSFCAGSCMLCYAVCAKKRPLCSSTGSLLPCMAIDDHHVIMHLGLEMRGKMMISVCPAAMMSKVANLQLSYPADLI